MKRKIKSLIAKAYNRLFRKKTCRVVFRQPFDGTIDTLQSVGLYISPENFRKLFESAYPDGAKFLEGIRADKDRDGNEYFGMDRGFYSESFISGRGSK